MSGNPVTGMGVDEDERRLRLAFMEFTEEDEARIRELDTLFAQHVDQVADQFYGHLLKFDGPRAFLRDETLLQRLKQLQKTYFRRLTQGNYDGEYFEDRLRVGLTHERVHLDPLYYIGAFNLYFRMSTALIFKHYQAQPEKAAAAVTSFSKLLFLDMSLAMEAYIEAGKRTIRKQQEVIGELSTPVIQVWEGILALPLIGTIDSHRTLQIMESLLDRIVKTQSRVVIMDITGVPVVDTQVANHLIKTMQAARLLGAKSILVGISPSIAQTLVHLGVDLATITTGATLKNGLEIALRYLKDERTAQEGSDLEI
jgi:rsbT co-antagonist protein RsbR